MRETRYNERLLSSGPRHPSLRVTCCYTNENLLQNILHPRSFRSSCLGIYRLLESQYFATSCILLSSFILALLFIEFARSRTASPMPPVFVPLAEQAEEHLKWMDEAIAMVSCSPWRVAEPKLGCSHLCSFSSRTTRLPNNLSGRGSDRGVRNPSRMRLCSERQDHCKRSEPDE